MRAIEKFIFTILPIKSARAVDESEAQKKWKRDSEFTDQNKEKRTVSPIELRERIETHGAKLI